MLQNARAPRLGEPHSRHARLVLVPKQARHDWQESCRSGERKHVLQLTMPVVQCKKLMNCALRSTAQRQRSTLLWITQLRRRCMQQSSSTGVRKPDLVLTSKSWSCLWERAVLGQRLRMHGQSQQRQLRGLLVPRRRQALQKAGS